MTEWRDYEKLVLSELDRMNHNIERICRNLKEIDKDISTLKVKSSFWGSLGGFIAVALVSAIEYLKRP